MEKLSNVHFEHPSDETSGLIGDPSYLEPISEAFPL
jgi:hypothetical protein